MKWNLFEFGLFLFLVFLPGKLSHAAQPTVNAIYKCEAVRTQASPNQVGPFIGQSSVSPSATIAIPSTRATGSRFLRPGSLSAADLSLEDQAKVEAVKKEATSFRSECRSARVSPMALVFQVAVLWCSLTCTVEVL